MGPLERAIAAALGPLKRRILLMVGRGVVELVNDGLKLQGLQLSLLAGEVRDDVERFQSYGFTSHPHPGAEAVVVFAGGDRSHGLAIAVDDRRYRLKGLAQGEVALYTDEGDSIVLGRGNTITVHCGGTVRVEAANRVEIDGGTGGVKGVVQGDCICQFTGNPHTDLSSNVKASK